MSYFTNELGPKRLGLLLELMAGSADIFMLANPKSAATETAAQDVRRRPSGPAGSFRCSWRATTASSTQHLRRSIRTNNPLERILREIRRRTRVVRAP
jgi:hypothetical protein